MHVSQEGIDLITVFEQFRACPYRDSKGVWTAGWGEALTDTRGRQIIDRALVTSAMIRTFGAPTATKASADKVFAAKLVDFELAVSAACATPTQGQFNAMVSMAYNCGAHAFDTSTIHRLHNAGQRTYQPFDLAPLAAKARAHALETPRDIPEAFAAWSESGGAYVLGLFRRRVCEALVYGGTGVTAAYAKVEQFDG